MHSIIGLFEASVALPSPPPSEHESCQGWDSIAGALTQSTGAQQQCWSNGTRPCTRIDCNGAYEYNSDNSFIPLGGQSIEVDYCFGIILNHCDDPISLDFYIQVPAKNVNRTTRIYHNTILSVPGLNYTLGSATAQGYLYFQMKRVNDTVTFSVTVKVRVDIVGILSSWPAALQRRLISNETVPVPPCAPGSKDVSDIPDLGHCHPPPWRKEQRQLPGFQGDLNKKCNETNHCRDDPWLMCDLDNNICICKQEFQLFNNSCIPRSRYQLSCISDDECNIELNERCQEKKCSCQDGDTYDADRQMCTLQIFSKPRTTLDTEPEPTVKPAAHSEEAPKKMHEQNTMAVVAGSVIGGIVVLTGLLIVAYFALRRLRGPYNNRELLLEEDGDGVM